MILNKKNAFFLLALLSILIVPAMGFADVEGTIRAVNNTLISRIIPLVGILAVIWASMGFFTGNPSARTHLLLALVGCLIAFIAPSLITFMQSLAR